MDAKIVFQDDHVYMLGHCPLHGHERVLVADDVDYYRRRVFIKPPETPQRTTRPSAGAALTTAGSAPTTSSTLCLSLVVIADACNLRCPTCYASSAP
ncbi:MAG: hypothetical protein R2752_19120 [Vicinamibacterales bacterium]